MRLFGATGQRLGSMTWSRAVLVLRSLGLQERLNSPDKHEAQRAAFEAERMLRIEEE